ALLRTPMTMDDYLNARIIADPIRLYDCVMPCAGGDAVIVTSTERAKTLSVKPIHILGAGQHHNYDPGRVVVLEQGWARFADEMFNQAGMAPSEINLVELYDDYPIMELIQLEALGL